MFAHQGGDIGVRPFYDFQHLLWADAISQEGGDKCPGARAHIDVKIIYGSIDQQVVDGAVNGVGTAVVATAKSASTTQTGNMRTYAGYIGIGAALLLAWFVIFRGIL